MAVAAVEESLWGNFVGFLREGMEKGMRNKIGREI